MTELETEYSLSAGGEGVYFDGAPVVIEVGGPDAAEYLQGQLTNDISGLNTGESTYALLLTPKGKVEADIQVVRLSDRCHLLVSSTYSDSLLKHLSFYKIGRDVTVGTAEGVEVVKTSRPRYERIEVGIPIFGIDFGNDNFPAEAGIERRAVDFEKGCYVGQEPVARMHYRGHPNRYLRGIKLRREAAVGEQLFFEGREVGPLTSVAHSPSFGPIALAVIRREAGVGTKLSAEDGELIGDVVELPFG